MNVPETAVIGKDFQEGIALTRAVFEHFAVEYRYTTPDGRERILVADEAAALTQAVMQYAIAAQVWNRGAADHNAQ